MKSIIKSLKASQKVLAKDIRNKKDQRKSVPNGRVPNLDDLRLRYRIHHIIYCLLRGKTMGQIESHRIVTTPTDINEHYLRISVAKEWKTLGLAAIEFPTKVFEEVGYAFVRPSEE